MKKYFENKIINLTTKEKMYELDVMRWKYVSCVFAISAFSFMIHIENGQIMIVIKIVALVGMIFCTWIWIILTIMFYKLRNKK